MEPKFDLDGEVWSAYTVINFMSKKCELTGKIPLKGHKVSHANNKTKRRFLPNLKKVRFKSIILIINKIYDTHYIDAVYCPNRVSVNYFNRYEKDDYYNTHVDNFKAFPKSNNVFFDYGFSVNLEDDYEGGELYFQTEMGTIEKKLKAGEAAIFPIFYPHGVKKITSGTRTNILGWLSSNLSYEKHFILKNVYALNQHLAKDEDNNFFTMSVLIQNYLKKEWGK